MLRHVWYKLRPEHEGGLPGLLETLRSDSISVGELCQNKLGLYRPVRPEGEAGVRMDRWFSGAEAPHTVILTDDMRLSRQAAGLGVACVGIGAADGPYFDGTELVLQSPAEIDRQELEEYLLRFRGVPVVIARTERLLLREIAPADFEPLIRLSREPGMEYVLSDENGGNGQSSFTRERLQAYVRQQYRLYGYGLWSVFLADRSTLIGCCGFSEYPGPGNALEMAYMLNPHDRRRGYGSEMCLAALDYAADRLGASEVWVRVHPSNKGAQRFAVSLGFALERTDAFLWMRRSV